MRVSSRLSIRHRANKLLTDHQVYVSVSSPRHGYSSGTMSRSIPISQWNPEPPGSLTRTFTYRPRLRLVHCSHRTGVVPCFDVLKPSTERHRRCHHVTRDIPHFVHTWTFFINHPFSSKDFTDIKPPRRGDPSSSLPQFPGALFLAHYASLPHTPSTWPPCRCSGFQT